MPKHILCPIDKVEIFDRYSILDVKYNNSATASIKLEIRAKMNDLEKRLAKSLGLKLFQRIIASPQYNDLYMANLDIYDAVNLARDNQITGKALNALNDIRTEKKRNLDSLFFGGNEMSEIKIDKEGNKI